MATPKIIGGYEWRYQVARGRSGLKKARCALQRLVEERRLDAPAWADVAEAAFGIQEATEALEQLGEIARRSR